MFEAAELGRSLSGAEFGRLEPELRTRLLHAQHSLLDSRISLIILVSGVEGAGKGEVVNRLNEWMDTSGIETHAFWEETDEQRRRPPFWRFWRVLPPRGGIGILFGSWYSRPLLGRLGGDLDEAGFERELRKIEEFERMLVEDGAVLVKLWFHLPREAVEKRLGRDQNIVEMKLKKSPLFRKFVEHYDRFIEVAERAIRMTDKGAAPWHLVEALDGNYRDITAGRLVLEAMESRLARCDEAFEPEEKHPSGGFERRRMDRATVLDSVDLDARVGEKDYRQELGKLQARLHELCWKAHYRQQSVVAVFEGWDAAGKGGAIRRITRAVDARLYTVISSGEPTDEELAHHYLWRFWRHLPLSGYLSLYDRSWYGRVLVERVEGLAGEAQWRRAYNEINQFEEQLCEDGIVLVKFWLHVSPQKQLRRFEKRRETPWKRYKLSEQDWRNRERRGDYELAVDDMVAHTSTEYAPWTLVSGEQKKHARIEVLRTLCEAIESGLSKPLTCGPAPDS